MSLPYQRIERAIGNRPPILGAASRRAIISMLLSIPTALLAFTISDKAPIPDWLRLLISPGVLIGFRFTHPQPCGGLLDCLVQAVGAYAKGAEIACVINAIVYGLLIFGVATTLSVHSRRAD